MVQPIGERRRVTQQAFRRPLFGGLALEILVQRVDGALNDGELMEDEIGSVVIVGFARAYCAGACFRRREIEAYP